MKRLLAFVTVALLLPMCALAGEITTRLSIDGMHCALCAPAVTTALRQVEGVKAVTVWAADGQAVVVGDDSLETEALIAAVAQAGFSATLAGEN